MDEINNTLYEYMDTRWEWKMEFDGTLYVGVGDKVYRLIDNEWVEVKDPSVEG